MANWISVNCIDSSDVRVSSDEKGQLSPGVIFTAVDQLENIFCFRATREAQGESVIRPINENSVSCLDCLETNKFKLIFRNCSDNSEYYISPRLIQTELPSVGSVYRATISELDGCYTFIGVTSDDVEVTQAIFDVFFDTCSDCLFNYNKEQIINKESYQEFKNTIKQDYNNIIQNRINPQQQEQQL